MRGERQKIFFRVFWHHNNVPSYKNVPSYNNALSYNNVPLSYLFVQIASGYKYSVQHLKLKNYGVVLPFKIGGYGKSRRMSIVEYRALDITEKYTQGKDRKRLK